MFETATTNLIGTQGGGASTDWTKWNHYGARTYWSSESQTSDPSYGNVYMESMPIVLVLPHNGQI